MSAENHMVYESASGLQSLDGLRWSAEQEIRDAAECRENVITLLAMNDRKATDALVEFALNHEDPAEVIRDLLAAIYQYGERAPGEVVDALAHQWIDNEIANSSAAHVRAVYGV